MKLPAAHAWLRTILCLMLLAGAGPALAEPPASQDGSKGGSAASPKAVEPDTISHHTLDLPGRSLHMTASAGFVRLLDGKGEPDADIAMTAYTIENTDARVRPVTFVLNGGPGMASAWLQMGAVGPWRIPMTPSPSAGPTPQPNADTWLDFTDLVFIDPVGTGYSTFVATGDDVRSRLWSVNGDIEALSQAIRRWLDAHGRIGSPKYLLGESYGGFRAPLLARRLAQHDGVGLRGLVMLSPVLDFGNRSGAFDLLAPAMALPSMAASVRAAQGRPIAKADLADVEAYASGPFLADELRGLGDPQALDRVVDRISALTGLDPGLVRRHRGLISGHLFAHEHARAAGLVSSQYDATVALPDPFPEQTEEHNADPILDGLRAPLSEAMLQVYDRIGWHQGGVPYRLGNDAVAERWNFGHDDPRPESFSAMRQALALDPRFHVIIAHGLFDLVCPYFATEVLLNQIPPGAGADRVRLLALPGGHMFYSRDDARRALRTDAERMMTAPDEP